jgi:hypothetical protein
MEVRHAVDELISLIIESERPLIGSIIHEFRSPKTLEKPAHIDSTTNRPNTTEIKKRHEATSPKSSISTIETSDPRSERLAETFQRIFGTNAAPKSGILEIDLNSKTYPELAKKILGEKTVNRT